MFRFSTDPPPSAHGASAANAPLCRRDRKTLEDLVANNRRRAEHQRQFLERSPSARDLIFGAAHEEALQMCREIIRGSTVYGEECLQGTWRKPIPANEHLVFALADQARLNALDRQMLDAGLDLLAHLSNKVEAEFRALESAHPGHEGLGRYLGTYKAERLNLPRREGQPHHEAVAALINQFRLLRQTISDTLVAHQHIVDVSRWLTALPDSHRVDRHAQETQLQEANEQARRSNVQAVGQLLMTLMLHQTSAGGGAKAPPRA